MAAHHNPDIGIPIVAMIFTTIASIWASIAMEIVHGIITIIFAVSSCVIVFFVNRWLKKKYK